MPPLRARVSGREAENGQDRQSQAISDLDGEVERLVLSTSLAALDPVDHRSPLGIGRPLSTDPDARTGGE